MMLAGRPYLRYPCQSLNAAFKLSPVHVCSALPRSLRSRHTTTPTSPLTVVNCKEHVTVNQLMQAAQYMHYRDTNERNKSPCSSTFHAQQCLFS